MESTSPSVDKLVAKVSKLSVRPHSGILVVDKPPALSSFAVVKRVRQCYDTRKVGHAGTLDPLATGVLPVCVGEATKIAGQLLSQEKAYSGVARLGETTDTLDVTGSVTSTSDPTAISREEVEAALAAMWGEIAQTPPQFSAVKVDGRPAYKRARRGEAVSLKARRVTVMRFDLTEWRPPIWHFEVSCSKGTYIRSLVRDVGEVLGCGAVLVELRRTRSGPFDLSQAISWEQLAPDAPLPELIPLADALGHLPHWPVSAEEGKRLRQGQPILPADPERVLAGLTATGAARVCLIDSEGEAVGLGSFREGQIWPKRIFVKDVADQDQDQDQDQGQDQE